MGATSVTGTGPGDVSGLNRGSSHMTLAVGNLLGPKIVVAGVHTLDGGDDVINIGTLEGDLTDYMVLANDNGATSAAAAAGQLTALNQVTIKGTTAHVINWAVVHIGDNTPGHAGSTV